jgi:hypothetical protein
MPAITINPRNTSMPFIFFFEKKGSNKAVKKPVAEKQTSATEIFAYLIDPGKSQNIFY